MKRDMSIIRQILQYAEEHCNGEFIEAPTLPGSDWKIVHYHIGLCGEAGYMAVQKVSGAEEVHQRYAIGSLTWIGHDALDRLRGN